MDGFKQDVTNAILGAILGLMFAFYCRTMVKLERIATCLEAQATEKGK